MANQQPESTMDKWGRILNDLTDAITGGTVSKIKKHKENIKVKTNPDQTSNLNRAKRTLRG